MRSPQSCDRRLSAVRIHTVRSVEMLPFIALNMGYCCKAGRCTMSNGVGIDRRGEGEGREENKEDPGALRWWPGVAQLATRARHASWLNQPNPINGRQHLHLGSHKEKIKRLSILHRCASHDSLHLQHVAVPVPETCINRFVHQPGFGKPHSCGRVSAVISSYTTETTAKTSRRKRS